MRMPANCDGRYPHFLVRLEPRDGPQHVICIDVCGTLERVKGRTNEIVETFNKWHCVHMTRNNSKLDIVSNTCGAMQQMLWSSLRCYCERIGTTWVVSYQCSRVWSLCGLWDRLISKEVRISGGDYRAVYDPDSYGDNTNAGILIAEDPPCLACIRIGNSHGRIMWLDVRNLGIDIADSVANGADMAKHLAELIQRIDNTIDAFSLGGLCPTAAGQSYRSWRTLPIKTVPHCHAHPRTMELEHDAHYGGRCECFRIGKIKGNVYHLDIRSAYGSIMLNRELPVRLINYSKCDCSGEAFDCHALNNCIAHVTIQTTEPAYPVRRDMDTIYPIGRFDTVLCGPELSDAWSRHRLIWIHSIARYERGKACESFARRVYNIRDVADSCKDKELSSWAKYVLNGLVGKAAQRIKRWEVVPGARAPLLWGEDMLLRDDGTLERWRYLAGVVQREVEGGYSPDAVPALAGWICSYGRMLLLNSIRIAGWKNVYYVDTDCLLVSEQGYQALVSAGYVRNGALGMLELRSMSTRCEIRGIKYYLEDDDTKCAGLCRGISVRSADGIGQWIIPPGSAGAKLGHETGRRRKLVKYPKAPKYRHGIVHDDGSVTPHVLRGD